MRKYSLFSEFIDGSWQLLLGKFYVGRLQMFQFHFHFFNGLLYVWQKFTLSLIRIAHVFIHLFYHTLGFMQKRLYCNVQYPIQSLSFPHADIVCLKTTSLVSWRILWKVFGENFGSIYSFLTVIALSFSRSWMRLIIYTVVWMWSVFCRFSLGSTFLKLCWYTVLHFHFKVIFLNENQLYAVNLSCYDLMLCLSIYDNF